MYIIRKKKVQRPLEYKRVQETHLYIGKVEQRGSLVHLVSTLGNALKLEDKQDALKVMSDLKNGKLNKWELLKIKQ